MSNQSLSTRRNPFLVQETQLSTHDRRGPDYCLLMIVPPATSEETPDNLKNIMLLEMILE